MKRYRAEIEGGDFELILAENEEEAIKEYWDLEAQGHFCYNLIELDENFEEVRTIL